MALPTRSLDDRSFQDLVDEAKKKIPLYCPEWTDHNVSDPGITLIELFCWLVDMLLYRVNQMPHTHYVKLLELLGITLEPPRAATVPLTFYFSAPQPAPVTIPRATAVSTRRVDEAEPVVFTTQEELTIHPAELTQILVRKQRGSGMAYESVSLARLKKEFTPFTDEPPKVGEALYLGFEAPLHRHVLGVDLTCVRAGGQNIVPENPPLQWQAWTEGGWERLPQEQDGTGGMSWSGQVRLRLPELARRAIGETEAYWVRCEVTEATGDIRPYTTSPIIREVRLVSWGATVPASHASEEHDEPLGRSDGSPGQVYHLDHTPILPRWDTERVEVWMPGMETWEPWREVDDFSECGPDERVYTLDSVTGEVTFGPALRLTDGSARQYGAIPPRGADIRFSSYRYGGGTSGNVRSGTITELKTTIAYVSRVTNHLPAQGGLDAETLEEAMFRAKSLMRTRYRAVTAEDYEFLARQAFPGRVARVRCLQTPITGGRGGAPSPGQVYVMIIPAIHEQEAQGYIPLTRLALSDDLRDEVHAYLDERRLLTTRLQVRQAGFKRVRVHARIVARPGVDHVRLEQDVIAALNRTLNPLVGGPDGTGWPFGRELYLSDLYACIQGVAGIQYIQDVAMFTVDEADRTQPIERKLELLAHEVVVSDLHQVTVEAE
ncbi:MAG: putative baseplate assembly protein [Anaerolineae bacterium]|nr:putative baseplate assembly protein [Anaerolineae bacterium]